MATHHASSSEIVDLETWAQDLPEEHSKVIIKTTGLELARLSFSTGDEFPTHQVSGPIVVHCIKGRIEFKTSKNTEIMEPDQLVYLEPNEPHSIRAISDSVVLLTIVFRE